MLAKKDIEKKREALEEEKSLIDERLQKRKDAEDEAEKYEQLAEYRRQLALISADSTRTKDAAELRKKIADIEKDIAWDIAEDEANAQKDSLEDQMKAYDQYIEYGDEDLAALLENANNFANEVNEVMQMSQSDMFTWLQDNVKEYANSLDAAQEQMVQNWEDTYKQMLHITDTYWDQINEILSSRDKFINYMMDSDEYKNASEDMKAQLLYQWLDVDAGSGSYDAWVAANRNQATYSHDDDEFANYTGESSGGGGDDGGSPGGGGPTTPTNDKGNYYVIRSGANGNYIALANVSYEKASAYASNGGGIITTNPKPYIVTNSLPTKPNNNVLNAVLAEDAYDLTSFKKPNKFTPTITVKKNAKGGLVDYTGLTWVDGTKLEPEAFLSSDDRAMMRGLLDSGVMATMRKMMDSFNRISTAGLVSHIYTDSNGSAGNTVNIGDINISTEQLNDELDMADLAQRIGNEFVKQLANQGVAVHKYSF